MTKTQNQSIADVAIIGAGVCGASIARLLSLHNLDVVLLEKEEDVSFGTSKANSGIIHGGFHHHSRFLKTRLELEGASLFGQLHADLGFPYKNCGILVVALHADEMKTIEHLYLQGVENGSRDIELCSRERMLSLEPKLAPETLGGLYAPSGGIIEPYRFVFSLVENARSNGVSVLTNFNVQTASRITDEGTECWHITAADGRRVRARFAVNAAGLFADSVSALFGAEQFTISARKGEYFLLDRLSKACPGKVIFPVPSSVSKGMLVIPTVEGTTLIGPTADTCLDKNDLSTAEERLYLITASAKNLVPAVSERDVITSFAGLRPVLGEDFYIENSKLVPAFVQVAGIQSPGLTASPAIAMRVLDLLRDCGLNCVENPNAKRKNALTPRVRDMDEISRAAFVKAHPAYGSIVCRCEEISEGEIVEAVRMGHHTLDGVKFYTRAQMGRCQGGFCAYKIIKIIMRETGLPFDRVTKKGGKSFVLEGSL